MFGSLGMFSLVLAVLCPMSFVQGQVQAQQSNITIVSDASTLGNKAFQPNPLETPIGTTVIWTNYDFGIHTVTDYNGAFESDTLRPDDTFEFTFSELGTYDYHCMLHPTMVAQVVVQ
jgi:plastocyanin